jgi:hypothetical protein
MMVWLISHLGLVGASVAMPFDLGLQPNAMENYPVRAGLWLAALIWHAVRARVTFTAGPA